MAVLLYAVVREGHRLEGVARAAGARTVRAGAVAAVVVSVLEDAVLGDDDIDAYLDTLIDLIPAGPVLPVEFGTIAPDDESVRRQLEIVADDLSRRLDLLDGLVEVRIDIVADEARAIRRIVEATPELERATRGGAIPQSLPDRVALGEKISFALADVNEALGEQLLEHVGDLAVAHAVRPSATVTELRHAYLIRFDDLSAFDAAVQELRTELDETYTLEYVGPLPAFDFTDLELEAGPRADESQHRWGWSR
jgi:hypothetical protein